MKKATLYTTSDFMGEIIKREVNLNEIKIRDFAPYKAIPCIVYTPKKCRKQYQNLLIYKPYALIIEGWGHPEPDDLFISISEEGGVKASKSKYACFDERFKTDFDLKIKDLLQNCNVILDCRNTQERKVIIPAIF
jgi:hypothetical protein